MSRFQSAAFIFLALILALVIGLSVPALALAAAPNPQAVPTAALTPELLAALAAIGFSLVFAYVPKVSTWYNALNSEYKASIMGLVIVLVGVGAFGLSCGGFINLEGIACTQAGIVAVVQSVLYALVANAGSYTLLVKPFKKTEPTLPSTE